MSGNKYSARGSFFKGTRGFSPMVGTLARSRRRKAANGPGVLLTGKGGKRLIYKRRHDILPVNYKELSLI